MIRAAEIIRSLDWRRRTAQLRRLDELRAPERDAVVAALAELPPDSKVDLDKLIEEVRRRADERAQHANPDPSRVWAYWLSIATLDQMRACKRALLGGATVEEAMEAAPRGTCEAHRVARGRTFATGPVRLGGEPDEEPSAPRRRIRRRRPRRTEPQPTTKPPSRRRLLGTRAHGPATDSRPLGCPTDVTDYEAWLRPARPAWLMTTEGDT